MLQFEKLLALETLRKRFTKTITKAKIETLKEKVYLVFTLEDSKLGEKEYKVPFISFLWEEKFDYVYESLIAADLIRQGYMLVPIEGGWLCVSPKNEAYSLEEKSCSCGDFLMNKAKKERCKHLIYRDWTLHNRARIQEYKTKLKDSTFS